MVFWLWRNRIVSKTCGSWGQCGVIFFGCCPDLSDQISWFCWAWIMIRETKKFRWRWGVIIMFPMIDKGVSSCGAISHFIRRTQMNLILYSICTYAQRYITIIYIYRYRPYIYVPRLIDFSIQSTKSMLNPCQSSNSQFPKFHQELGRWNPIWIA